MHTHVQNCMDVSECAWVSLLNLTSIILTHTYTHNILITQIQTHKLKHTLVTRFGGDIGLLTPSSSLLAPLSLPPPPWIESTIWGFGFVLQTHGLLPLLLAPWSPPSPISIPMYPSSRHRAYLLLLALHPMSRTCTFQFPFVGSRLMARNLHLDDVAHEGSLSSLRPMTSNIRPSNSLYLGLTVN